MITSVYSKLLKLYPKDFFGKFSDEMLTLFAARLEDMEEHGVVGIGLFVLKEFAAALFGSIREHLNQLKKRSRRTTGSLEGRPWIDPRIRGAIILSVGFGLSQIAYSLLTVRDELLGELLGGGFLALMLPEALCLMIALVFIFEISLRGKRLLPASLLVSSSYVIGITILIRSASFFAQIIPIDQKSIWLLHRFIGMGMVGLLMGYFLDIALSNRWKPSVIPLLTGLSMLIADLSGYASFALYNLVQDTPLFGPWSVPEYFYMLTLQAIIKGLVLGIGLGYIQNQFKKEVKPQAQFIE